MIAIVAMDLSCRASFVYLQQRPLQHQKIRLMTTTKIGVRVNITNLT